MQDEIRNKMERFKLLAEDLLNRNKRVYISDINNQFYMADILFVGENTIEVQCFAPKTKAGQKFVLNWLRINDLNEYEEKQ